MDSHLGKASSKLWTPLGKFNGQRLIWPASEEDRSGQHIQKSPKGVRSVCDETPQKKEPQAFLWLSCKVCIP